MFEKKHGETREVPLKKFPYVVLYQIEEEDEKTVVVFAVFHTRRNPKKKRIG